jgi:hypothetical protein
MANRLTTNPIYVDQFNADVVIAEKGRSLVITKVVILSASDGDIFQLEDGLGNHILHMVNTGAADTVSEDFDEWRCSDGVQIDVSECTGMAATNGTDAVWIYHT